MKLILIFVVMQAAFIAAGCLIIFGGIFIEMLKKQSTNYTNRHEQAMPD
ncbi:MAG: hypothetical protein PHH77_12030 [Victivallaceae bacterium]|nr:hypothetical protein [Victivallaceae bacterium]